MNRLKTWWKQLNCKHELLEDTDLVMNLRSPDVAYIKAQVPLWKCKHCGKELTINVG